MLTSVIRCSRRVPGCFMSEQLCRNVRIVMVSPKPGESDLVLVILTMRAWAVWGGGWRLGIGLLIFLAACWSSVVVIIPPYLRSLQCGTISLCCHPLLISIALLVVAVQSPPLFGCLVTKGSNIISICWVLLLVYESGELSRFSNCPEISDILLEESLSSCFSRACDVVSIHDVCSTGVFG